LEAEEGATGPPTNPTSCLPPTTRAPEQKLLPSAQSPSKMACHGDSSPGERRDSTSSAGGVGSYFPSFLPRRLTILLSNAKLATERMTPSTYHSGGAEPDRNVEDLRGILATPRSSSLASSPPLRCAKAQDVFPDPGRSYYCSFQIFYITHLSLLWLCGAVRIDPRCLLDPPYPVHDRQACPPNGAPGYTGKEGWNTGGFSAD